MSNQMQISDAELKEIAAGWPDEFRILPKHVADHPEPHHQASARVVPLRK